MEKDSQEKLIGNLACFVAYIIFGFNIVSCKAIANNGLVSPLTMFLYRSGGAMVLFWIFSLFSGKAEKVSGRDMLQIALASFIGLFLTQLSFLEAMPRATAVDASIIGALSPVATMLVAAVAVKDRITVPGIIGLLISIGGVLLLIFNSSSSGGAEHTSLAGFLLMMVNMVSFACYLGAFRPLIRRYKVVTFMKWMFLFSTLYALPFCLKGAINTDYASFDGKLIGNILYVVVMATFVSYFLIPIGQKRIKPVMVGIYSYLQPVVAMAVSVAIGMDSMSLLKGFAALMVFAGVGIVNFLPHRK